MNTMRESERRIMEVHDEIQRQPLLAPDPPPCCEESAGRAQRGEWGVGARPLTTWIPAGIVMLIISAMYTSFMVGELVPQVKYAKGSGIAEMVIFHIFLATFAFNYFATMFKSPGDVPHNDPEWKFAYDANGNVLADGPPTSNQEVKADGDRRRCKWCMRYKPDRCHHCRICKTCVLKMDHHCPWTNNCVGFHNHKNFVLTTFYGFSCCIIIAITCLVRLCETHRRPGLEGAELAFNVAALIMGAIMFLPLVSLYGFHIWLALKGLTTIEFCEKRSFGAKYRSRYYVSPMKNLKAVLGENPLSWFCCWGYPKGDGMHFENGSSRTQVDLSVNKPTNTARHKDKLADWNRRNRDPEVDRGSGKEPDNTSDDLSSMEEGNGALAS